MPLPTNRKGHEFDQRFREGIERGVQRGVGWGGFRQFREGLRMRVEFIDGVKRRLKEGFQR